MNSILVAIDFKDLSYSALEYGREFARVLSGTLHLVHVVDDLAQRKSHVSPAELGEIQTALEARAHEALDGLLDEALRSAGTHTIVLTSARAAAAILTYARDASIDLIVVGAHNHGGFADLFMGSTAQQIVRMAPCPVLVVRHPSQQPRGGTPLVASTSS